MSKTAFVLMIITLLSKVTGLIREQVFAYFLGTGMQIDAFNTATTIPSIIFGFVIASVVAGFIPTYNRVLSDEGESSANLFVSNLLNIVLAITTVIILFVFIAAPLLVSIFAPSYSGDKRYLAIAFTRILTFSLYISSFSAVFIGFFQIKNKFVLAETPGLIMNFFYIISVFVAVYFDNIFLLPLGVVISEGLKYILFPRNISKLGYKHTWEFDLNNKYIKEILKLSVPIIVSIAAVDVSHIVDQAFASSLLENGGVSSMRYANLLSQLINGVILTSITTSIYPTISKFASENNISKVKESVVEGITLGLFLIIPSIIGSMILSEPLIRVLFQRGVFDAESTRVTSSLFRFYLPLLFGQTFLAIITRGFYSLRDTRTPIIVTIVSVITNVGLNILLSRFIGINGVAIATSVSIIIAGFVAFYLFRIKYGRMNIKLLTVSIIKIGIASLIMGIVTSKVYYGIKDTSTLLALITSAIASIIVYSILVIILQVPMMKKLVNQIYKKFRKK